MFMVSTSIARMEGEYLYSTDFTRMNLGGNVPQKLINKSLASMVKADVKKFYEDLKKL